RGSVGNANTSPGGDPPLLFVGDDGWFYAQSQRTPWRTRRGQGLAIASASDTDEWVSGASCGLTNDSGEVVSGGTLSPVMASDRSTGLIVAYAQSGDMRASTDRGATWSSTRNLSGSLSGKAATAAQCWNGLTIGAYTVGAGPNFSQIWWAS